MNLKTPVQNQPAPTDAVDTRRPPHPNLGTTTSKARRDHTSNRPHRWIGLRSQPVIALVILVERLDDERPQW